MKGKKFKLPSLVAFLSILCLVDALKIPFSRRVSSGVSLSSLARGSRYSFASSSENKAVLNDVQDLRYTTNITINGVQVQVALDTGSSDLWVMPPGGLGTFNDTGLDLNLLYGDDTSETSGTIGVAPFQFGSYSIDKQAFLNAVNASIAAMPELGIYGLMGLSFASASWINEKVQSVYGSNAMWGQSVLANIFQQDPEKPNFIAMYLARSGDLEDSDGGSFTIGEYDPRFATVANKTKLPQNPKGGQRWTTLLEGIYVDGQSIGVSTAAGIPVAAGKIRTLLDSGTPTAILPVQLYNALYSSIPGSAFYGNTTGGDWFIPCNTTTIVEVDFGGERYPIHPLDLSIIIDAPSINGTDWVTCVSSFYGIDNYSDDFDALLGDDFLRNVYSVFDFGDTLPDGSVTDPYIQLLSQVDPAQAKVDVSTIRANTMSNMPPEIDPATLVAFLNTQPASTFSDSGSGLSSSKGGATKHSSDLVADTEHSSTLDESTFKKYGVIVICLLATNLVIGLALITFGVLSCIRRGKNSTRTTRAPAYVPVKSVDRDESYSDFDKPYAP